MSHSAAQPADQFIERRTKSQKPQVERRQFANSHDDLAPEVRELALAIDEYKLRHRRRFISYDEMYTVIRQLGYHK